MLFQCSISSFNSLPPPEQDQCAKQPSLALVHVSESLDSHYEEDQRDRVTLPHAEGEDHVVSVDRSYLKDQGGGREGHRVHGLSCLSMIRCQWVSNRVPARATCVSVRAPPQRMGDTLVVALCSNFD